MRKSLFKFELPEALIAQKPLAARDESRLLRLQKTSGEVSDHQFSDLLDFLEPGDCLVFNNTKVIPARIYGHKATGGKVECLIERVTAHNQVLAHIKASKAPKPGAMLTLGQSEQAVSVIERQGDLFLLALDEPTRQSFSDLLESEGHMPLPPYITREDVEADKERYQTVYASQSGAVAAPTAGLHFTEPLLAKIRDKGVSTEFVTLHVGAGTFQPVRVDDINEHQMHSEWIELTAETANRINQVKQSGGRIVAVGTTSVRVLECTAALLDSDELSAYTGETELFITPGYRFRVVDAMVTNFHLSESTLLMLVSAFATREQILSAYQHAVDKAYRFFSYGDAMFIE